MKDELDIFQILEEFSLASNLYLEKFGENSLDNIFLFDPVGCVNHPEEILKGTSILKDAIESNTQLDGEYRCSPDVIF